MRDLGRANGRVGLGAGLCAVSFWCSAGLELYTARGREKHTSTTVQGQSVMVSVVASVTSYCLPLKWNVVGAGQYVVYSDTTRVVVTTVTLPAGVVTSWAAATEARAAMMAVLAYMLMVFGF